MQIECVGLTSNGFTKSLNSEDGVTITPSSYGAGAVDIDLSKLPCETKKLIIRIKETVRDFSDGK